MKSSGSTSRESVPQAELHPSVVEAVLYVSKYMGEDDDWVDIKIEIMNSLRPELRRLFSRRDQATREQVPSDFDREVMRLYEESSGVKLVVRTLEERKLRRAQLTSDDA